MISRAAPLHLSRLYSLGFSAQCGARRSKKRFKGSDWEHVINSSNKTTFRSINIHKFIVLPVGEVERVTS